MGIFGWDYPPGESGRASAPYEATLKCPKCGYTWVATMFDELGGAFLQDDEEGYCKECGEDGEVIDR